MAPRPPHSRRLVPLLAIACLLLDAGCAGLRCPRCPRIDPTGERCLIWPKDEAALATVAPPATVFPANSQLPAIAGNTIAPPVLTDSVFPQQAVAAPVAAAPGVVVAPVSTAVANVPQDRLTLSPERMLAPVGSEVVLKANICTTEGYTLAEQKIEWMLARDGVGEFVEVSGKGAFHPPVYPWNAGKKTDNYLATSYTANGPHCITRGTPDVADDVAILRGDAWVSVTSPREGTSHVTAFTPGVESWDLRKQIATIYWVDVQWTFPPGTVSSGGRETLTTTVVRQSDRTPLAGWIVRYEVSDGATSNAASVQEVVTDAEGRASVNVTPTASGAASSKIDMQLVRPANFAGSDAPRLVIGNGTTIINWSGGSTYLPPSSSPLTPTTPTTPVTPAIPTIPNSPPPVSTQPLPVVPNPTPGQAKLELELQGQPAQVGGSAPLRFVIRNVGTAPATNVVLIDNFDPGLIFPDKPRSAGEQHRIGTLAPGATYDQSIVFGVSKAGQLCHNVTVTYAEGEPLNKRECINVTQPAPQRQAGFKVDIDGPRQAEQGQTVRFKVTVKNTGETALVNIITVAEFPPAVLDVQPIDQSMSVVSGVITYRIERLDVGQLREYEVNVRCRVATRAVVSVRGTAATDPPGHPVENADDHDLEILQARGQGTGIVPPVQGSAPAAAAGPLGVKVSFVDPSLRVGAPATCRVLVRNNAATAQEQVAIQVRFPPQLTPVIAGCQGPQGVTAQMVDGNLRFSPVATINAGETLIYTIPVNPTTAGMGSVTAQAVSKSVPTGVLDTQALEILANRL